MGQIAIYDRDDLHASLIWAEFTDTIYINFIYVDTAKPQLLVKMLAEFRGRFRGWKVQFEASSMNREMQRLIALLKAECCNGLYTVQL